MIEAMEVVVDMVEAGEEASEEEEAVDEEETVVVETVYLSGWISKYLTVLLLFIVHTFDDVLLSHLGDQNSLFTVPMENGTALHIT